MLSGQEQDRIRDLSDTRRLLYMGYYLQHVERGDRREIVATLVNALVHHQGGITAAGSVYSGGYLDFAVVRYGSDGVLDPTFGDRGIATVDFGGDDGVGGLAVDGGGRLVLAGGTQSPGTTAADFALVRLRPNGSIDDGFGAGGRVVTDFGGASDTANAVVSQPDGALLVLGQSV